MGKNKNKSSQKCDLISGAIVAATGGVLTLVGAFLLVFSLAYLSKNAFEPLRLAFANLTALDTSSALFGYTISFICSLPLIAVGVPLGALGIYKYAAAKRRGRQ